MQPVTLLALSSCLSAGLTIGLLANLKLSLVRDPDRGQRKGFMLTMLNLALVVLMALSGVAADTLGVRPVMVGGSVLLALALLAIGLAGSKSQSSIPLLAASLGACALYVCTLAMMPKGLMGINEVAASLNLGLVFVALGALLLPPLFELLKAGLGFPLTMAVMAVMAVVPAALAGLVPAEEFAPPGQVQLGGLVTEPTVWVAGLVFFIYAPLEAFVGVWATTYCASHDETPGTDSRWLAWFWLSFSASRVLLGLFMHLTRMQPFWYPAFLVVPALLAAVCLGNMSGSARHKQALGGLLGLGLFLGPVLPMLLAILVELPASFHNPATAYALLVGCGAMGSLVLSPLVGWSTSEKNAQAALRVPLFIALSLAAVSLFFVLIKFTAGR